VVFWIFLSATTFVTCSHNCPHVLDACAVQLRTCTVRWAEHAEHKVCCAIRRLNEVFQSLFPVRQWTHCVPISTYSSVSVVTKLRAGKPRSNGSNPKLPVQLLPGDDSLQVKRTERGAGIRFHLMSGLRMRATWFYCPLCRPGVYRRVLHLGYLYQQLHGTVRTVVEQRARRPGVNVSVTCGGERALCTIKTLVPFQQFTHLLLNE
jgi:hypothetical protein